MPGPFINDLLPFATGPGANVLPQVSYQGLPARLTGFVSGVAESAHLNKAWRQSAFTTAMIGQFTVNNALEDVLDDGNVDEYERKFRNALRAVSSLRRAPLGGTALAATVAFVPPLLSYNGAFFLVDVTIPLEDNATLKVDALAVRALRRDDGSPIQKGDAPVGAVLFVCDDGSGLRLLNMTAYTIQSGSTNYAGLAQVSGTQNAISLNMNPPVFYHREGAVYRFKPQFDNDGPVQITLNSLAAKPLTELDGNPLPVGALSAGHPMWIMDAGATFVFLRFASYLSDWSKTVPGLFWASANSPGGVIGSTNLSANAYTKINIPYKYIDEQGDWYDASLSRYTPKKPGYFYFNGDAVFGSSGSLEPQASHGLRVFKNTTPTFTAGVGDAPGSQYAGAANGARGIVSGISYLNGTTDFVQIWGYQDYPDTNNKRVAASTRWGGWFLGV